MTKELVSVIIVTFNNESTIRECLISVDKFLDQPKEIIVVDNASADQTLVEIEKSKVEVVLMKQSENLGFSKANNKASVQARGDYLFFLNPDAKLTDHNFPQMLEYMKERPEVGLIAPKLVWNSRVQQSVTHLPTLFRATSEYWLKRKHVYSEYAPAGDQPVRVEAVYGAALLLSRSLFEQIGRFDERYFLYFEDLELSRQLKKLGSQIIYYPLMVLEHKKGVSAGSNPKTQALLKGSSAIYHGQLRSLILYLILRLRPS